MANQNRDDVTTEGAEKDPNEWVTGDESMTGPQASYLKTLSQESGKEFDPGLTKAEAGGKHVGGVGEFHARDPHCGRSCGEDQHQDRQGQRIEHDITSFGS